MCARRQIAYDLQVSEEKLRYCYECMEWILTDKWPDHCRIHIQSWGTQHCEIVTYRHTVIRPGYCPFCPWTTGLPEDKRMHYWTRNDNSRQHIEEKPLCQIRFPTTNPICGCSEIFQNEDDLRHHLYDIHGLKKAIWLNKRNPRKRKRTCKGEQETPPTGPEGGYHHSSSTCESSNVLITGCPEQFEQMNVSRKPNMDNESIHIAPRVPMASHLIKSQPTETGIDLIDPRILHSVETIDQIQMMEEMASSPNAQMPPDDVKSIVPSFSTTSIQSLVMQSTIGSGSENLNRSPETSHPEDCAVPEKFAPVPLEEEKRMSSVSEDDDSLWHHSRSCSDEAKLEADWARDSLLHPSNQRCPSTEPQQKALRTSYDQLHRDFVITRSSTRAGKRARTNQDVLSTRAQKRARSIRDVPDCANRDKKRMKLNAKEKRKLTELKSQRFTLRQIGSQFPSIDKTVLRQAWEDLRPSQRLTRLRARAER